ncbi:MAG: hypothetical protein ACFFDJ_05880 [Candidatus Odinarchaeota archaeon]
MERISIDNSKIQAYFLLLEYRLKHPKLPRYQLVRRVQKETGFIGNIKTMSGWLRHSKVQHDVKIVLADGYNVNSELIETFSHLRKYLPKDIK